MQFTSISLITPDISRPESFIDSFFTSPQVVRAFASFLRGQDLYVQPTRNVYTNAQKLAAMSEVSSLGLRAAARKYSVPVATLSHWIKESAK